MGYQFFRLNGYARRGADKRRLIDLMLVAMEDPLVRQGDLPGDVSRSDLRRRLEAIQRARPSERSDAPLPSDPTSE